MRGAERPSSCEACRVLVLRVDDCWIGSPPPPGESKPLASPLLFMSLSPLKYTVWYTTKLGLLSHKTWDRQKNFLHLNKDREFSIVLATIQTATLKKASGSSVDEGVGLVTERLQVQIQDHKVCIGLFTLYLLHATSPFLGGNIKPKPESMA